MKALNILDKLEFKKEENRETVIKMEIKQNLGSYELQN